MRKMEREPTHPGKLIGEACLKPLAMTISEFTSGLGVSRKTLSKILNARGAVAPNRALRLARAFNTTADFWLSLQKNHDVWQAEHTSNDWQRVRPLSLQLIHARAKKTANR